MENNERTVVELDDFEYRANREPEDVSDLLLKVIDAPVIIRGRGKSSAGDGR